MSEEKAVAESEPLLWETRGQVAILTLNRPQAMNSFDMELMAQHRRRLEQFQADDDLRVLVYTGNGRAFSTGIDIKKAPDFLYLDPQVRTQHWVTRCDIRIAAQSALIGLPEVKLGALPGGGGTQWLPRLIGMGDALMMMLTGDPVSADEALRLRLVQKVVPDDSLLEEAMKMAQAICDNGKSAVRLVKEVAMLGIDLPAADALWLEEIYFERNRTLAADEIEERIRRFQQASKKKK
jgi:enoyl-CoA hydratase/carnithine racemase